MNVHYALDICDQCFEDAYAPYAGQLPPFETWETLRACATHPCAILSYDACEMPIRLCGRHLYAIMLDLEKLAGGQPWRFQKTCP